MNRDNIYQFGSVEDIKNFLIGGNSTLTLESKISGNWFTYRIRRMKDDEKSPFFVSVLTGSDNECSYTYMGTIFDGDKLCFKTTQKSKIGTDALSHKAFKFFLELLVNGIVHKDMGIYHTGVCGRCNRKLTTPESIKIGLGPECRSISNKDNIKKLQNKKYHMAQ